MNEDEMQPFNPYEALGGAGVVSALVNRFYDLMDDLAEARDIRAMHPADLSSSREKLFMFLSGFLGGPQLYFQRFGHPRLRQRHLPFSIGKAERDQWMLCMELAAEDHIADEPLRMWLLSRLAHTADFMQNREEDLPPDHASKTRNA